VFNLWAFPCERAPPLGASALLPVARCQSSGPLGALLSSPALVDVRLLTALQVLQVLCRARQVLQERALLLAAMGTAAITQMIEAACCGWPIALMIPGRM